jgi:hypothetical protein
MASNLGKKEGGIVNVHGSDVTFHGHGSCILECSMTLWRLFGAPNPPTQSIIMSAPEPLGAFHAIAKHLSDQRNLGSYAEV